MKTKSLTKVTLLSLFVMSVITAVTLNSCQKEVIKPKTASNTPATARATNDPFANSSKLLDQLTSMVFSPSKNQKGLVPNLREVDSSGCATITIDTVGKPHTVTYNYGASCTGSDGVTRSGVVILSYDQQDIRVVNNVYSVTLQNYGTSGFIFNGSISYTNTGYNTNGNLVIAQTGLYVGNTGSATDTVNINYSYEWITNESSTPLANIQFKVTGSCVGTSSDGTTASNTITSPLIKNCKNPGCNYFIQGTTYSTGPNKTETTDYGNPGGCSGQMSVTKNGITNIQNQ